MKRFCFLVFLVLNSVCGHTQDTHFSQIFSNPVYLNPAFAGYDGCSRINTAYRLQWPNISGRYHIANVSYDQLFGKAHGVAVNYDFDMGAKTLQTHAVSIIYAPTIKLFKGKLKISPAVQLGWRANYIDWSQLTFGEMIDPRYGFVYSPNMSPPKTESHMFDLSTGLILSHHNLVYGAAFHHITQPNEGFSGVSRLPIKYTGHITYTAIISDKYRISPSFVGQNQQDFISFLTTLTSYIYGARIGIGYRGNVNNPDAILFMVGYQGKRFKVGYSYDLTISTLTNRTGGSHELSLSYRFNCKNREHRKGVEQIAF